MADTIKHRKQTAITSVGADVDKNEWNDSHVMSGGVDGQIMTRNSGAADGWSWQNAPSSGFAMTGAQVNTNESTSSLTYVDLTTTGPAVTVTLTGSVVIVWMSGSLSRASTGNSGFISVALSGANTVAAADSNGCTVSSYAGAFALATSRVVTFTGLSAGSTTFKLQYRCDGGGPWNFSLRSIAIAYT